MMTGMTVKITVSLPDELAEEARRAVRAGEAASVSAYVAAAIEAFRDEPTFDDFLAESYAETGPPSAEAVEWARQQAERLGWFSADARPAESAGGAA